MKRIRVTVHPGASDLPLTYETATGDGSPAVRVQVWNWNVTDSRAAFLLRVTGDLERFEAVLAADDGVDEYERLPVSDAESYCFVTGSGTADARDLWTNFKRGSLMTIPPATWNPDGSYTFTLVGRQRDIQTAVEEVPQGARVDIESVGTTNVRPDRLVDRLSVRQREAVEVALEQGYYDVPRAATGDDVAAELGCATATATEHLRKAESKILRGVFRQ